MLHTILNIRASLFSALSRSADTSTSSTVSTVDTQSAVSTGGGGGATALPIHRREPLSGSDAAQGGFIQLTPSQNRKD